MIQKVWKQSTGTGGTMHPTHRKRKEKKTVLKVGCVQKGIYLYQFFYSNIHVNICIKFFK